MGVQNRIDPDLTAHACSLHNASMCNITYPAFQDHNRYFDMIVHYRSNVGHGRLRVLVLEDAAKAVHIPQPQSFGLRIAQLQANGIPSTGGFLKKHLPPSDAGKQIDTQDLAWVNSTL